MTDSGLTLTVGDDTQGRKVAIITCGGHPQRESSDKCTVLTVEVVDGWDSRKIWAWFKRMKRERPWETRQ
jgi:hypothetical protein